MDVYRGVVVILMFAVHARRIQSRPAGWLNAPSGSALERACDAALECLMWAEPYIAASFLFLVGYSMLLSLRAAVARQALTAGNLPGEDTTRRTSLRWRARMLRRAGWLYLLSLALFVPQFGVQWPDLIFSSGILSAIAVSIVTCALLIPQPAAWTLTSCVAAAVLIATALLHQMGAKVSGLNAGPGGAFPLLAAASLGVLAGLWRHPVATPSAHPRPPPPAKWFGGALILVAAAWSVWVYGADGPWIETLRTSYLDYGGVAVSYWLEHGLRVPEQRSSVAFWNHTSLGMLYLFGLLWLSLSLTRGLPQPFLRGLALVRLLGRHALLAYVMHLAALGLIELFGAAPSHSLGTWVLVLILTAAACALGAISERLAAARR